MDGTGIAARFYDPIGAAMDAAGNLYVLDNLDSFDNRIAIRKISPQGVVTTWAEIPGTELAGIAVDAQGNVYVSDQATNRILKLSPRAVETVFAGSGTGGSADGPALSAQFFGPTGLAVDASGNVYVADQYNHTARKIAVDGTVSTLAGIAGIGGYADGPKGTGQLVAPWGIAVDSSGNVYVSDEFAFTIRKIDASGTLSTLAGSPGIEGSSDGLGGAATFGGPCGIAVDGAGDIFVADSPNDEIREVSPAGEVTTVAGMAVDGDGFLGSGDGAGSAARFAGPTGVAIGQAGLYVTDTENDTVRLIAGQDVVSTVAGAAPPQGDANGSGPAARFAQPHGVAADANGNIYVADTDNGTIRKITAGGVVTTLAGVPLDDEGGGYADGPGKSALFDQPWGVAADASGNVYVSDTLNRVVRKITPDGTVSTLAGTPGLAGTEDGMGAAALFDAPEGIAVDAAGNIYVGDDYAIRKITPAGKVTTLAGAPGIYGYADGPESSARFGEIFGLAVDREGDIYVADPDNRVVREVTAAGLVSTVAGHAGQAGFTDGTIANALFYAPYGVAVDDSGNLYVADGVADTTRQITPAGSVTTLAGDPFVTGRSDGAGAAAQFGAPFGIAVDPHGTLVVADFGNDTIREGIYLSIATQPLSQTVAIGGTAVFSVSATGAGVTYQWYLDGVALPGATDRLYATTATAESAGSYTCSVSYGPTSAMTAPASLATSSGSANPGRLTNLSVLTGTQGASSPLTVGFVSGGAGTAGMQNLLVRAIGPALANYSISDFLPDPTLEIFNAQPTLIASNSGWASTPENAAAVTAADAATYAFALANPSSHDSATVVSVVPGAYTAEVNSPSGATGEALAEVYDATPSGSYTTATPRLINLSCLAPIDNVLTEGFVVGGTTSKTVLIRAAGPALAAFGVPNPMPDPQLVLFDANSVPLASNAGWAGDPVIAAEAAAVGAFAFSNPNSGDSAVLITLAPGAYTVQTTSVSGASGEGLVEIYEVP